MLHLDPFSGVCNRHGAADSQPKRGRHFLNLVQRLEDSRSERVVPLTLRTRQSAHVARNRSPAASFQCRFGPTSHLRNATVVQTASTIPNGHVPAKNPYADDAAHAAANRRMNPGERSSKAYAISIVETAMKPTRVRALQPMR